MGSAFKPFVYTAAIDRGYTPSSIIVDEPISYEAGPGQPPYMPHNYDGKFEGGVTIGTGDFMLEAFGYYGDDTGFSSMFIFGVLAYDFGGPPAFFITGVALGFGYNSNLLVPTIDQVQSFPFVQVLPTSTVPNQGVFPNNQPLTVLNVIMNTKPPWVSPQAGSLWFAAGITFTSSSVRASMM